MSATDTASSSRMPRQIPYIIGNEGCERFSFYGMRNILVQFLITSLLLQHITAGSERELAAKDLMHTFMIGVYFFPLLGGYLADRFFGKYNTILWFSLIYCAGRWPLSSVINSQNPTNISRKSCSTGFTGSSISVPCLPHY
jgi:POT family proton-dependent oligopeptide transporter